MGIVEKANIIDGRKIEVGDTIIGLASSGPHTNGYTLLRNMINEVISDNETFLEAIMKPHRSYYLCLNDIFPYVSGLAHITGEGIVENLNRILPSSTNAIINFKLYEVLPVFKYIQEKGNVALKEMQRVFTMGVGLALVCKPEQSSFIINHINFYKINAYEIGEIVE